MSSQSQRSGIRGVSSLRKFLRRVPEEYTETIRKIVHEYGEIVLFEAQKAVPKRTGTLARELQVKYSRDGLTARVGIIGKRSLRRAWYGIFVEFGNAKVGPRPFLQPALRRNAEPFMREIEQELDRTLDRISPR